jgi:hypothetical protein
VILSAAGDGPSDGIRFFLIKGVITKCAFLLLRTITLPWVTFGTFEGKLPAVPSKGCIKGAQRATALTDDLSDVIVVGVIIIIIIIIWLRWPPSKCE